MAGPLPRVIEFRSALRKLGITEPEDEIAFVKNRKAHVFMLLNRLPGIRMKRSERNSMPSHITLLFQKQKFMNGILERKPCAWTPMIMSSLLARAKSAFLLKSPSLWRKKTRRLRVFDSTWLPLLRKIKLSPRKGAICAARSAFRTLRKWRGLTGSVKNACNGRHSLQLRKG